MDKSILPHLNELSIYQLRLLARQVGVGLPTTYKKQDLIDKIKAIMSGEELPHVKKTNKGRPAKNVVGANFLTPAEVVENVFTGLDSEYKLSLPDLASYESLKPQTISDKEESILSGYVEITKDGFGYFMTVPQTRTEPIYVKIAVVSKFNLRSGDKIEAKVLKDSNSDLTIVSDVLSVNKCSTSEQKSNAQHYDFESAKSQKNNTNIFKLNKMLPIDYLKSNLAICLGDRVLLSIEEKRSTTQIMFDILNDLNKSNVVTDIVFVGLDVNDDFLEVIESFEKVSCVVSRFGDAKDYQKKIFEIGLMHAKTLSSVVGKNVVLVMQNLSEFLELFVGEKKETACSFCKKYFASAKQTQYSSLTCIYSVIEDDNLIKEYLTNENIFLKFLPHRYLTKCQIKYNMLNSYRTQIFGNNQNEDKLLELAWDYLESGDYFDRHLELEKMAMSNPTHNDLINELNKRKEEN